MPRSGVPFHRSPCAATYRRSGLVECTRTAEICFVASRPIRDHVLPASVDLYMPSPYDDDCPRTACSPLPTYTTLGSDSATAIAPMDPVRKNVSEMLRHEAPAFSVFHTPPPV